MKPAGFSTWGLLSVLCLLPALPAAARQPPPPPPPSQQQARPPSVPARDARAVSTGTGSIRGKVFAEDNSPVRRARVSLSTAELSRAVATGLDGYFEFQQLPEGRFRLSVSKPGYVTLEYGQRRPFQAGRPIDLAPGQVLEDLVVRLPRGAVIAGRVLNDLGEPVAQTLVTAFRQRYREGRMQLVPAGRFPETDDQGRFRLSGLASGTYFVGTFMLPSQGAPAGAGAAEEGFLFAPSYHPSTSDPGQAAPITVKTGEEQRGADITLVAGRAVTVSGTAYDTSGRPIAGANVSAMRLVNSLPVMGGSAVTGDDGRFVLRHVGPGDQRISVSRRNPETGAQERGETMITTLGTDVEGVVVNTQPPGRIAGRLTFEPDVKADFLPSVIRLQTAGLLTTPPSLTSVRADWGFELKEVPVGKVHLVVSGLPKGWAVRRLTMGGQDLTHLPFEMAPGAELTDVEVLLTNRPASIGGAVTDTEGRTAAVTTVLLFADDASRWADGWRSVVTVRPDQHGEFTAPGLLPGRWRVIALEFLEDGEEENPALLRQLRDLATLVTLAEGESVKVALQVVTPRG